MGSHSALGDLRLAFPNHLIAKLSTVATPDRGSSSSKVDLAPCSSACRIGVYWDLGVALASRLAQVCRLEAKYSYAMDVALVLSLVTYRARLRCIHTNRSASASTLPSPYCSPFDSPCSVNQRTSVPYSISQPFLPCFCSRYLRPDNRLGLASSLTVVVVDCLCQLDIYLDQLDLSLIRLDSVLAFIDDLLDIVLFDPH
jgi:hypothetical protein